MDRVFFDDYVGLDIGAFPHDYSPVGEYNYKDLQGLTGHWTETTNHSSWREDPSWNVSLEDGKRVLELSTAREKGVPIIVTGDFDWTDYRIETTMRPLGREGVVGVVFRYQTSRHWYAIWHTRGEIQIVRKNDEKLDVMASAPCSLSLDTYTDITVQVTGDQIHCGVGQLTIQTEDNMYLAGKVGFAGTGPARFGSLSISMSGSARQELLEHQRREKEALLRNRAEWPQPILWKKILTPGFGTAKATRFGDLTGDGKPDILLAQSIRRMAGDNFCEISCLTAVDLDGKILWQIGEPNPKNTLITNDLPVQIHDIDGDGRNEVIFCQDFRIKVVDGATGQLKYQMPTPEEPTLTADRLREDRYFRTPGDSLYFCDLEGRGQDRNLLLKDRYNNIWAYTPDLQLLWHFSGAVGHYPMAYDINGDGKDEVLIGYYLLNHDGSVIWSLDLTDHADGVAIGPIGPAGKTRIVIAGSDEGMVWVSPAGEILKHIRAGHCQTATVANLDSSTSDREIVTVTFWGNPGIVLVYDPEGNQKLRRELIAPRGTALSPVAWNGTDHELILISGHPSEGGMIDGNGQSVVMFPDDGHPYLCCEPIDLTGDGRDEIVLWDENAIWIYRANSPGPLHPYRPFRQKHYNMSNYRAQMSLPIEF